MNTTIRQKNSGYQAIVSYKQGGKWKQKSKQGFKKQKEAKVWADEIRYTITEDIKDNIEFTEMTVKEALEIYLEYKKNSVKFTTFQTITAQMKNLKELENLEISKIKPIQITTFIQKKQQERKKAYNVLQKSIRNFFNFCINELKIIRDNPCNYQKNKTNDKRIKYINKELYNEILNNISDKKKKLFIKIAYHTGMRKSEIFGLKISDIKDSIITVSRQRYNNIVTGLKSENGYRQIPINAVLYKELKNINTISIDGFIFPQTFNIGRILEKFNVSIHCFRHTFATNLVAKGYNLKVSSEILGDKFETFINTYVQSSEEEKEKVFKKIIDL